MPFLCEVVSVIVRIIGGFSIFGFPAPVKIKWSNVRLGAIYFFVLWFVGQLYQNYILCTVTSHIYPSQPWQLVRVVVRVVMVRSPKIPTASKGRCSLKREKSHLCGIHLLLSLHWPLAATTWANKYTSSCQVHAHAQAFIFKMHIVVVLVKVNLMLIVHLYQLHIFKKDIKNWATNICWNQTKILIKFNLTR